MKEVMILMAATKSAQELAVEVHDLSRQLVEEPEDQEVQKRLAFCCQILVLKQIVGDSMEKALQMIRDIDSVSKTVNEHIKKDSTDFDPSAN